MNFIILIFIEILFLILIFLYFYFKYTKKEINLKKLIIEKDNLIKNYLNKIDFLQNIELHIQNTMNSLAHEALKSNSQLFLNLAQENLQKFQITAKIDLNQKQEDILNIINPIKETLKDFNIKIQEIEKNRISYNSELKEQIKNLFNVNINLKEETHNLSQALNSPKVKGRWGEMQLKRTVEIAGLINKVDFVEQQSIETDTGIQRPDMIINLPNQKKVIIDAKVPLNSYMKSLYSKNNIDYDKNIEEYVKQVKSHIIQLSSKAYWKQFDFTPEFVVLFLPGESFFSAALEKDPDLIDFSSYKKVILSTPTTLIALLKTIALGWKEENISKDILNIINIGKELNNRIFIIGEYLTELKNNLKKSVLCYNKIISSFEHRIIPTLNKIKNIDNNNIDENNDLLNFNKLDIEFNKMNINKN